MELNVLQCVAWSGNLQNQSQWISWANGELDYIDDESLPALKEIPAMQRRRLSPFAKITLDCVLKAGGENVASLPCVFASRHGDLHKTAKLIEDVANKETLSPTNFGLSVHNAVAGLFSIYSDNKQPMTAIAAGEDTLTMALVDCYGKLKSGKADQILLVYSDQKVPEKYAPFVDSDEKSVAVALLLTLDKSQGTRLKFSFEPNLEQMPASFLPFSFLSFFYGTDPISAIYSERYRWCFSK